MDYPISVPGVGLVDGKFVDEDQVTGTPGSLIPAAWGNAVTDELLNILARSGIAPSEAQFDQLAKAIFDSPTFGANAKGATAPQFDSSLSLVTTAFLQRALGSYRTAGGLASGAVISAANIGGVYQPAEGGTVLFPTPNSLNLPLGASVTIMMQGRVAATINGTGGATFATNVNGANSFSLVSGQVVTLSVHSGTEWAVLNHLQYDASFSSSLTANGSQKLPGGFLLKWATYSGLTANTTTTKTRPSAFPTALLCESITSVGGSAANVGANGSNATQVSIRCETLVPTSVFVISIGI